MTVESAYPAPKTMKTQKGMTTRSNVSLFYLRSTYYVSDFNCYSCCMGFLSLSEAKFGVLWKSLGHAEKFLFSKLYRCFPKGKHGYLYVELVMVTALALLILLIVALPAAYVLARYTFRGSKLINTFLKLDYSSM
ncbi:hypothetical protein ACT7DA_16795 [Bacillus pacificus]